MHIFFHIPVVFRFVINDSILIKLINKFTGPLWIRNVLMTLHEGGSSLSNNISNEYLKKRYITYISSKGEKCEDNIYITFYTTKLQLNNINKTR